MHTAWYILRTRPNAERKIGQRLGQLGIEHFVALQTQVRQWHDRSRKIEAVLLPCYVFVHTTEEIRKTLFPAGSQGYLMANGLPATVSEAEMERLRRVCAWEGTPEIDYSLLRKGQTVEVLEGHFQGFQGEVVGLQGQYQLRLVLPILGCTMVVNISGAAVRAVPAPKTA